MITNFKKHKQKKKQTEMNMRKSTIPNNNTPIGLLESKFGKEFILKKVTKSTVIGSGSFG